MAQEDVRKEGSSQGTGAGTSDEERSSERKMGLLLMAMGVAIGLVPWLVSGAAVSLGTGMSTVVGVLLVAVGGRRLAKTFGAAEPAAAAKATAEPATSSSAREAA